MRKRVALMICLQSGLLLFLFLNVKAQVYNGNLELSTQAQVDAFNYTEVNGIISINGNFITNLNGLSELTKCNSLHIITNQRLTSIIGLANLQEVKNDLRIIGNSTLTNLVGLSSLTTVGTAPPDALIIQQNDRLLSIDGLFNLTFAHSLRIIGNAELANVDGLTALTEVEDFFVISNNPQLTSLLGLSNFTGIGSLFGNITIDNNDALITLDGLSGIIDLPNLNIRNNSALTNLDGLSNLEKIFFGDLIIENNDALTSIGLNSFTNTSGSFIIKDNDALTNVDGFPAFKAISNFGDLVIDNNPLLANIDGFSNLERLDGLSIDRTAITDLNGLSNVTSPVYGLSLGSNPNLINIDGLSNIHELRGSITINDNKSLDNIDGLSNITETFGPILIVRCPALRNIDGLAKLTWVGRGSGRGDLSIGANPLITNLDGLSSLEIVDDLIIQFNRSLTDFCGLYKLFNTGTIDGVILITNNGANTVDVSPPPNLTVYTDPGQCSATLSSQAVGMATPIGCLQPFTITHSEFEFGNVFPVGTTQMIWEVEDGADNRSSAVQTITVIDNQNPQITCPGNITVKCASDVPGADINSVTASDNCSVIVTHDGDFISNQTCANRFTLTRTYTATDPAGNTAKCSQVIAVNDDVPPQLTDLSVSKEVMWPPNHKMQDITVNYTATDNCVSSPIISVTVTSNESVNGTGDGDTAPDWEIINNHHVKLRAERAANGDGRVYTITVTVDDGCNPPVSSSKQVIVAHNITAPQSGKSFKVGSTVSFSGEFWDKPTNTHTAKWLLDGSAVANGIVSEPAGNQKGKVTGSYKFRSAGVYKLQMNVTDQNGVTSYANTNEDVDAIVVIYDPNGGYTYGGGFFNSPAGALISDPTATGKASYGFAMNYFKNSTFPKGEAQLEFKVGAFEFNALNFDYLVINNAMAQFKGTGKIIGGQSGIGFTMTVTDGQLDGTGIDKIRLKIYNKNSGTIIYDNQPGSSDAALPTQSVGANSTIVISGTSSSLTKSNTTTHNTEIEATDARVINDFDVIGYPNPSTSNFSITVQSNAKEKITMQVTDMYGRVIETKNITANSVTRFGDQYRPGTYFVRIVQGKEHKAVKLIKLSD